MGRANVDLAEEARVILSKVLKIGIEEIKPESNLQDDLGIDSPDFWDILAGFEKKFGVRIKEEEAASLTTVSELIGTLERKIAVKTLTKKKK